MAKKFFVLLFISLLYLSSDAQNLTPSDADSKIAFTIKNMGISVDGTLQGLKGKMIFDPKKLPASAFDVTVDAGTINTANKRRDEHLKKSDFFDVTKYPVIAIKTTSITAKGGNNYTANAVLTMHGVAKNIQFDFTTAPISTGYRFKAAFTINRKDYGVGGNSMTMSDEVKVDLEVVGKK